MYKNVEFPNIDFVTKNLLIVLIFDYILFYRKIQNSVKKEKRHLIPKKLMYLVLKQFHLRIINKTIV